MVKVFLGGTCNESTWRDELIKMLKIDYFNPVVDDWTEECMEEELRQRDLCDYVLYVITPEMAGVYSIAEVIDDSNKQPDKTIFCVMSVYNRTHDVSIKSLINIPRIPITYWCGNGKIFNTGTMKSFVAVGKMVERNGGIFVVDDLEYVADLLNTTTIKDKSMKLKL